MTSDPINIDAIMSGRLWIDVHTSEYEIKIVFYLLFRKFIFFVNLRFAERFMRSFDFFIEIQL